eukprot:1422524-Rhodomonas_salina.2
MSNGGCWSAVVDWAADLSLVRSFQGMRADRCCHASSTDLSPAICQRVPALRAVEASRRPQERGGMKEREETSWTVGTTEQAPWQFRGNENLWNTRERTQVRGKE